MPTKSLLFVLGALVALSFISILIGVADFSLRRLFFGGEWDFFLLGFSRLPRTLAALLMGASLAVAGLIIQMLTRNRFVGPSTMGTTEFAALTMLLIAIFAPGLAIWLKMSLAALGSGLGTLLFLALIQRLPPQQPFLVPLVGLLLGGIVGALATAIAIQVNLFQLLATWVNGDFSSVLRGRYELLWGAGFVALATYFIADQLTIAGLGRETARSLGLPWSAIMVLGLAAVSIISALTVVTVGMIPFVGLIIPNLVARFFGDDLRRNLPLVAGAGALSVLSADILSRLIRFPFEIPVGTVFGVIGALVFLILLLGGRHGRPA